MFMLLFQAIIFCLQIFIGIRSLERKGRNIQYYYQVLCNWYIDEFEYYKMIVNKREVLMNGLYEDDFIDVKGIK